MVYDGEALKLDRGRLFEALLVQGVQADCHAQHALSSVLNPSCHAQRASGPVLDLS